MAIYVTGDTHGGLDISKLNSQHFPEGKTLTKKDYVIIVGDFGFIWSNVGDRSERYYMDWFKKKPWTTLFIDGNHENFERLNSYPVTDWNGGKVHKINDSVIHLMRGQIFKLQDKTFFTMGGAISYDKENRTQDISWWPEEIPSYKEETEAIDNLHDYLSRHKRIDFILTHTISESIADEILGLWKDRMKDPTWDLMNEIEDFLKGHYIHWFFGHWHIDKDFPKNRSSCLYQRVIKIL